MSVQIRELAAQDLPAWRELFRAYGVFYETEFSQELLDRVGGILLTPGSGVDAIVAEDGGTLVGLAHYRRHPDTFTGGWDWYLDDLYVDPATRGAGVGTALIEALTALAHEAGEPGTLRWITAADNETAQRVYDRVATRTTWVTYEKRF
ncbi:GNAT family N-acetyltransferase [uncultured Schumannella sp.]|uniref:GNAT family N-acetyltransferase n=1 Tax=uncultured Schumannella sp. TaxID=1195956 RepID=UPI0025FE4DE5|nr:GNAT family N-acetyltransferase [uncultured Schumannella sp.]